jgi:GNAT superfamily N-acetyltransferase
MKKLLLLYILISSNFLLLSSEHGIKYTKNTCNRTHWGRQLSTDEERKECRECTFSRLEVYDKVPKKYIAHIAYSPSKCSITYLSVDEEYRKKGIGRELANRAIEDMRANHNCREISLLSVLTAERFWEKLGAKARGDFVGDSVHVFPESYVIGQNPSSNLSLDSKQPTIDLDLFYDKYATVI